MSEELEQRYLYTVNPKRPIRNLNDNIPMLRIPKTLSLTKEEVLKCLEGASVYRRFSNQGIMERVTKYDIDRVHRDKFISKQDWNKLQEKAKDVSNLEVNGTETQPTNEDPSVVVTEEKKEEEATYTVTIEDATEAEYTEGEPEVIATEVPLENLPKKVDSVKELETIFTSGYVETEEDAKKELPEFETVTNNEEPVEYNYKDLVESEESGDEEESDEEEVEGETSEDASNTTATKTVVNYGKKKKHKH